jgi:murein DD-endopeptidase MepM/ murein hydrolase activator NlpD
MARRAVLVLVLVAIVAAPAGADSIWDKKQSVDAQIGELSDRLARARSREATIKAELESASDEIRTIEQRVGDVSTRLTPLERELELREARLRGLDSLYRLETSRIGWLWRQEALAVRRLSERLVALYEHGEPNVWEVIFSADSLGDLLDKVEYLRQIAEADERVAASVTASRRALVAERRQTAVARKRVRQAKQVLAVRVRQARELKAELEAGRASLLQERGQRREALAKLTAQEGDDVGEMEALQTASAQLGAAIRAAEARASAGSSQAEPMHRSSSGFMWPVNGPVTSPFGWRWGRMHEGIDIGVGYGTPIRAAASGRVIYAGWMSGYGNLVAIDHGGGLSTAYGHQSQLAVSYGQDVSQGQVIGYVGSTGHSTGPHLHFEVRVNGSPVDPLGYL